MATGREWDLPESAVTDRKFSLRRALLKRAAVYGGIAGAGYLGWNWYRGFDREVLVAGRDPSKNALEFARAAEAEFRGELLKATDQAEVARHVNYYEFNPYKSGTWRKAAALPVSPWEIAIGGLVDRPLKYSIDDLVKAFPLEERIYRHRCVETWAMVVPWLGFPLRKLIEAVQPKSNAKFVRFTTADTEELCRIAPPSGFPWPYREGLTLAEASNELAFLAVGFYGERLFKQNGAPVRLVVPWKYGFKSAKSLVRIDFVERQPSTFWNAADSFEYGFYANVDPEKPHPRWSQASEWLIDTRERRPTEKYNGYGKWVAHLYRGDEV